MNELSKKKPITDLLEEEAQRRATRGSLPKGFEPKAPEPEKPKQSRGHFQKDSNLSTTFSFTLFLI